MAIRFNHQIADSKVVLILCLELGLGNARGGDAGVFRIPAGRHQRLPWREEALAGPSARRFQL